MLADLRIAIAGDLHGAWDQSDHSLLATLKPDGLLVVGDLSDGHQRIPSLLRQLKLPVACVLGNHDTGKDSSGRTLQRQIEALGPLHCGWGLSQWPGLAVVGARPATAGGGVPSFPSRPVCFWAGHPAGIRRSDQYGGDGCRSRDTPGAVGPQWTNGAW